METMTRAITSENFGAWLIKCDPKIWDFVAFVEAGNDYVDRWSVIDNYRSHMMQVHDRILFWKSGDQEGHPRGIWGIGHVTGEAHDVVETDPGYWLDDDARRKVTYSVPVYIPLFDEAVTEADLRAAGIDDLEVQKMPGGSNPSWLTAEQLDRIDALLGDWPDLPELTEELTVSDRGAGFGSIDQNRAVEDAAMAAVVATYESEGWDVEDVSADKLGWDLACTHPDGSTAKVEVKGVSGNRPIVLLTANEIRAGREEPDWVLAVVTRALAESREILVFDSDDALAAAAPYVYRADMARVDHTDT
jgi:Protein NO VEIN, C-terminal/EVE domain